MMTDFLNANFMNTPIPVILVVAGILFLILSLGGTEPLKILQLSMPQIPESQRSHSRIMGVTFVVLGFLLTQVSPTQTTPQTPTDFTITIRTVPNGAQASIEESYGLSDNEIASGSVPDVSVLPQPGDVSDEEQMAILEFVITANLAETLSYALSDPSYAAYFFAGDHLLDIEAGISDFENQGLYYVPLLHTDSSYYTDIRIVNDTKIEVDGCESWSGNYYSISDDSLVETEPVRVTPQTITIEFLGTDWYITRVVFHNSPTFCETESL